MRAFKPVNIFAFLFLLLANFSSTNLSAYDIHDQEYWMGIYSDSNRVGYSYILIKNDGKIKKVKELTNLKIHLLGNDSDVYTEGAYVLEGYKILSFEYEMRSEKINLKASGKREGNNLVIVLDTISGNTERTIAIEEELILPSLIPQLIVEKELSPGDKVEVPIFEPLTIMIGADKPLSRHMLVAEEEVETNIGKFDSYKIQSNFMGADSTSWITKNGEIIKQEYPPSLLSIRESKKDIFSKKNKSFNIVQKTSIPTNVEIKNPQNLSYLKIKLSGIDISNFDIDDRYRQIVDGQYVEIRTNKSGGVENPYVLPYDQAEYENLTEADFLVQSDDKDIVSITNKVLAGERDPVQAAKKINTWIYRNLKKSPTVSLPNAKDVLKTKVGDCNEHAALFTAMSRAAGIPTKTVLGTMYYEDNFYYHAWNEVYVGEWIAVDSTYGQFPADATHIKLIEGNLAKSGEILKVVGKLNIEIIDAS